MARVKLKWLFLGLLVLSSTFIWFEIISFGLKDDLKVVFLDVGQGDAIFIETKTGNQVLIDGGTGDRVLRELSRFMPFFDKSIDMIVATHPDSDHIGGLISILERFETMLYLESGARSDTLVYRSLEDVLDRRKPERITAGRDMVFDLGNGVLFEILFPDRDVSNLEANTASIISKLIHGGVSFMLTGDSPVSIEKYLVSLDGKNLQSEILKVGHHGSKTSTSELFLGFVSPEISVISAGFENRYGHPHEEVTNRLENFGVEVLNTAEEGSITFLSNGKEVRKGK